MMNRTAAYRRHHNRRIRNKRSTYWRSNEERCTPRLMGICERTPAPHPRHTREWEGDTLKEQIVSIKTELKEYTQSIEYVLIVAGG
ncbi:MAG: hypothetical protein GY941_11950 [Planctomycetes bacterium]|nr:hypothetical protein [Planctomycetota bacterium]